LSNNIEMPKQLAAHYRDAKLRVRGSRKWIREEDGSWTLQQFDTGRKRA